MASKTYNVGVIGYGLSAKVFHIPLILVTPSFVLHSIVQRTPKPNDSAATDHPTAKIYSSATDMFADPSIDIIVVTTTPETHFAFTKSALEAGKHVIVEKPFVPAAAEAVELDAISKRTGKLICVYQNRRWDSDFLTVRKLIEMGTLGRVVEFETHFDRWKPVRPETWKGTLGMDQAGGVIYDLGVHIIDQAYVLFGLPKTVTCVFSNQRNDDAEPDSFTVLLGYGKGGPLVTAKAGVLSVEVDQLRFWVRGSKASYKKFHLDVQEDQLRAGKKPGDEGFGIETEDRAGSLVVMGEDNKPKQEAYRSVEPETYAALYGEFAKAIEEGSADAVPVKASQAADVLRIIEAAKESAKSGKTITL